MDNTEEFRCISLCSGYGGIELGLRTCIPTLRTVCYVEREAFAAANLVAKIEEGKLDAAPIWTDIKTFDGRSFRDRVHIITAGYPCQGESVAGKRLGKADPRWLWPYIERIIKAVRPVWFFGENVPGHLTLGYPEVYRSLRNLGYSVEAGLFSAAECGAPHRRTRLFILAKSGRTGTGNILQQIRGWNRPENVRQENGQACTGGINATSELADTRSAESRRLSGCQRQEDSQIGQQGDKWPARPGQPQYEWEEPRVVANTEQRCRRRKDGNSQRLQRPTETARPNKGQAQSRLGRAVDGITYPLDIAKGIRGGYLTKPGGEIGHDLVMEAKQRVDRLRLLGNGVVPQCAEKAFRVLMGLFER